MAVQVLIARGVPEDRILFLNIIASPEGVNKFARKFPRLKVVTAFIDQVRQLFLPQDSVPYSRLINVTNHYRVWMKKSMSIQVCQNTS